MALLLAKLGEKPNMNHFMNNFELEQQAQFVFVKRMQTVFFTL